MNLTRQIVVVIAAALMGNATLLAQKQRADPVCSQAAAAVFKPLPELTYECPEGANDSDDAILKLPQRLTALHDLIKELAGFTSLAWWQADVDQLNACAFKDSVGELTDDQKRAWKRGDYRLQLFGNHEVRLVLIDDPCYQTGYNGSNAFLIVRKHGRVAVTQALNGYYSRADNSVKIDFANLNGQKLIEVSTANSMPPSLVYYYFVINPKTNQAVPKNIFKEGRRLTNQISSAMIVGESRRPPELKIISRNRLNPTFSAYHDSELGIDDGGRKLRRIVYRWNGRFYAPGRGPAKRTKWASSETGKEKLCSQRSWFCVSLGRTKGALIRDQSGAFIELRDQANEPYLNAEIEAGAQFLVSRDRDLLDLMDWNTREGRDFQSRFPRLRISNSRGVS